MPLLQLAISWFTALALLVGTANPSFAFSRCAMGAMAPASAPAAKPACKHCPKPSPASRDNLQAACCAVHTFAAVERFTPHVPPELGAFAPLVVPLPEPTRRDLLLVVRAFRSRTAPAEVRAASPPDRARVLPLLC